MAKRGRRPGPGYDHEPIRRIKADEQFMTQLREQVSVHALGAAVDAIDSIALNVAAATGASREAVAMLLTQMLIDGANAARWVKAGSARAAGIPITGMLDALGLSSPTSLTRMASEVDAAAEAQELADMRGEAVTVRTTEGILLSIQPASAFHSPGTSASVPDEEQHDVSFEAAGVGEYDAAHA